MKSQKGQTGFDLLISYGWVVVVGVIAIIMFANLGFMNFGGCDDTKVGFSQVVPTDWEIYPKENRIALQVENWAGESVTITDFNASFNGVSCLSSTGVQMDPGEDRTIDVLCLDGAKMFDRVYSGTCYSAQVSMIFEYPSGETFKSVGTVKGRTTE